MWGHIWQKHGRKKTGESHLSVLPGGQSDVGVGADWGRGVQVIGADVIECVTESTAHRAAVIPAKGKTCGSSELHTGCTVQVISFPCNLYHAWRRQSFLLILYEKLFTFHFWKVMLIRTECRLGNSLIWYLQRIHV